MPRLWYNVFFLHWFCSWQEKMLEIFHGIHIVKRFVNQTNNLFGIGDALLSEGLPAPCVSMSFIKPRFARASSRSWGLFISNQKISGDIDDPYVQIFFLKEQPSRKDWFEQITPARIWTNRLQGLAKKWMCQNVSIYQKSQRLETQVTLCNLS